MSRHFGFGGDLNGIIIIERIKDQEESENVRESSYFFSKRKYGTSERYENDRKYGNTTIHVHD